MESESCLLCTLPPERIVLENRLAIAILDGFPVTSGHALVIPRRHAETYFDLDPGEVEACHELLHELRENSLSEDPSVTGSNIGMNAGAAAGQTHERPAA